MPFNVMQARMPFDQGITSLYIANTRPIRASVYGLCSKHSTGISTVNFNYDCRKVKTVLLISSVNLLLIPLITNKTTLI